MSSNTSRKNFFRQQRRRGAMLVLVAVMMALILGMAAFAVDVGFIVTNKTRLQSAADAAALAGASTLVEDVTVYQTEEAALSYAQANAPDAYTTVTMGYWDPVAKTFSVGNDEPNAVRAVVERTTGRNNAIPSFFAHIFGHTHANLSAESIAVGAIPSSASSSNSSLSVYVTSTKDLSNVVLEFEDGVHQKFEGLSGYSGTFSGTGVNSGKALVGVWIKSGCYMSGDGPGYGEYVANPGDNSTMHGNNANKGCVSHVTATFSASGVTFTESGTASPIRLVR